MELVPLRITAGDGDPPRLTAGWLACTHSRLADCEPARLVLLEGGDDAFCAGLDLESPPSDWAATLASFGDVLDRFDELACPVIAVVEGAAIGGGVGLAAAADVVIASPDATFGLPETLLGLIPAVVYPFLERRIGPAAARRLAIGAPALTAHDAHRLGLVDELVEDTAGATARLAARFARLDHRAVAAAKRLGTPCREDRRAHRDAAIASFARLAATDETMARLRRFAAGESPWDTDE